MSNIEEIKDMANSCLNCKTMPCSKACPMNTRIPEFIQMIKEEKYKNAYDILNENNNFSYICSIVCPQEDQCQGSCVKGIKSVPTQIGKLEKFINEWAIENGYKYSNKIEEKKGKKVAIIGSGPAGLSCSIELLKHGIDVTIYEKDSLAGGLLMYGIPDFRLSKDKVNMIVENIKQMGANIILNTELGKDIFIKDLVKEYDAIFLGIGAEKSITYKLSDENIDNIYNSDFFLKEYSEGRKINNLGNVVVIGGGNVAIDCARTAIRMNADSVSILYRRDRENMPARNIEIEDAIKDGVKINYQTRVISAIVEEGKMEKVKCIKTEIIDKKAIDIPNSEFEYNANTVVFAIGLKPDKDLLQRENIKLNENNLINIDENGKTNIEKVYAGGDVSESKSTVCRALASGRKAAISIIDDIMNN